MDFFEAQARAKKRSGRLVVLFALAVLGTIAALYLVFVAGTAWLNLRATSNGGSVEYYPAARQGLHAIDWWQPGALKTIILLVIPTIVFSTVFKWFQLRAGGAAIAEMVGGRRVEPDTLDLHERTLLNVVEEMALASGLSVPAVYVLPDERAINAFAAGYSPADAAVAVTDGALRRLDRDELQGVIAHEFSHILNGDMRLNTRLSALVFGLLSITVIGRVGIRIFRESVWSDKDGPGRLGLLFFLAGLALLVIGYIGHLFGKLIQAAVSRQREFLADAAAVQFTRLPAGLTGALKKLGGTALAGDLVSPHAAEVGHFCFAQNFRSDFGGLFATHPPLDQRIRAIDPAFDGRYIATSVAPRDPAARSAPFVGGLPAPAFATPAGRVDPTALIASSGSLSPASVAAGRALLDDMPESLRAAAHDPARIAALCYALCLPRRPDPAALAALLTLVAERADPAAARATAELHAALEDLPPDHRLPLLQLATPVLRHLAPAACATLLDTLDAVVHADGVVTPHEFALQKILSRTLGLAARPRDALHVLAPAQVVPDLSLALSAAARLDHPDPAQAAQAFARAAMDFNGLQPPLAYHPAENTTLAHLDVALDRLALTPAPFRKRILAAIGTALAADGTLSLSEAELLRAIASALDCPLPPVLPVG